MDNPALESLLRDPESPSSERKQSFSDADRVCQAICAYSNDMTGSKQPGYIFIGAKDDGSPSGLPITDKLLLDLIALRSDGRILPQPRMVVEKRTLLGAEMAVIEVFPADLPPVRFKGVVWIGVGPRRDRANEAEERALSERGLVFRGGHGMRDHATKRATTISRWISSRHIVRTLWRVRWSTKIIEPSTNNLPRCASSIDGPPGPRMRVCF